MFKNWPAAGRHSESKSSKKCIFYGKAAMFALKAKINIFFPKDFDFEGPLIEKFFPQVLILAFEINGKSQLHAYSLPYFSISSPLWKKRSDYYPRGRRKGHWRRPPCRPQFPQSESKIFFSKIVLGIRAWKFRFSNFLRTLEFHKFRTLKVETNELNSLKSTAFHIFCLPSLDDIIKNALKQKMSN